MTAPAGLAVGDTYIDGELEFEIITIMPAPVYYEVQLLGVASRSVTYADLLTETREMVIVEDANNSGYNGLWIFLNGNYEKQVPVVSQV